MTIQHDLLQKDFSNIHLVHLPLSSNRQHYEIDDCQEDNREDY